MFENRPQNWRIGQTIYNFIAWLGGEGKAPLMPGSLGDTFYISDSELEKLYKEFLEFYNSKTQ